MPAKIQKNNVNKPDKAKKSTLKEKKMKSNKRTLISICKIVTHYNPL